MATTIAIKLSPDFNKVQISTNDEKIIMKFVVLSITLARQGTILAIVREITRIKKVWKRIILESNGNAQKVYSTSN